MYHLQALMRGLSGDSVLSVRKLESVIRDELKGEGGLRGVGIY